MTTQFPPTPPLHPESAAFIARLTRPDAPPFYALPLSLQRRSQEKMLIEFSPALTDTATMRAARMERSEADGGPLPFRCYRPQGVADDAKLPLLCWFHGGGWTVGSLAGFDAICRELAQLSGCALAAIGYRQAPEHKFPAATDDAFFALRWLATHADELNIDAARLAVGGDSAGGNLATVAALRCRDAGGPNLAFQLLVYPDVDKRCNSAAHFQFADGYVLTRDLLLYFRANYLSNESDCLDWRVSPLLAPSLAGLPPTLIVAASHDPLRNDGLAYSERLKAAGVAVERIEYPGMVHNFFTLGGAIPTANRAVAQAAQALRQALHPG